METRSKISGKMMEFLLFLVVIILILIIAPWIGNVLWMYWDWVDEKFSGKP